MRIVPERGTQEKGGVRRILSLGKDELDRQHRITKAVGVREEATTERSATPAAEEKPKAAHKAVEKERGRGRGRGSNQKGVGADGDRDEPEHTSGGGEG